MNEKKKVLIGDDTVDYGITTASTLRGIGMYAITRRKDGNIILNAILASVDLSPRPNPTVRFKMIIKARNAMITI